jgi:hypothetical protein
MTEVTSIDAARSRRAAVAIAAAGGAPSSRTMLRMSFIWRRAGGWVAGSVNW